MFTEHRETPEEEAFWRLFEETEGVLSEAAYTLLDTAKGAAYAANMVHNYSFQPQEHEEAEQKMRAAAAGLTQRDRELLGRLWRVALAAAASLDPDDHETMVKPRIYVGDLHWNYTEASSMVEDVLEEKEAKEYEKESAEREPEALRTFRSDDEQETRSGPKSSVPRATLTDLEGGKGGEGLYAPEAGGALSVEPKELMKEQNQ